MGASVFAAKRGGIIVTCAATTGYMIEYDNRHLWMKLKTIKGSHFANYREAWDANQLVCEGKILPPLSAVHPLEEVGDAAYQVHQNLHEGKIGVLCLAPEEGLGIDDPELRAQVGEDRITLFRRHGRSDRAPCSPRSTTWPSPSTTSRRPSPTTPTPSEPTVAHRERVESDGVEEALLKVADSYIQLLTPTTRRLAGGQVPREEGRGHPPRRLPGGRLRPGPPVGEGPRRAGHRRGAASRVAGDDRGLRASQGGVRHADRARPGVAARRWTPPRRLAGPPPDRAEPPVESPSIGVPSIRPADGTPAPVPDPCRCRRSPAAAGSRRRSDPVPPAGGDPAPVGLDPIGVRADALARSIRGFPPGVSAKLRSYVYLLVDPRTGRPFYVGRGTNDRCFRPPRGGPGRGPARSGGDVADRSDRRTPDARPHPRDRGRAGRHGADRHPALRVERRTRP